MSKMFSVLVNVAVYNDQGQILLSQRSFDEAHEPGKWTIPGGKLEADEEEHTVIQKNAAREVLEEVGVTVTDEITLIHDNTFTRSNGDAVLALIVLCKYKSGIAQSLDDTIAVAWVNEEDLDSYEFPRNVKEYVQKAFATIASQNH